MNDDRRFTLRRWSQRKLSSTRTSPTAALEGVVAADRPPGDAAPVATGSPVSAPALPPVATLTFESDFAAFLRPGVDAGVCRAALRKLLRDPRFNVMDGLDVYIDDYAQPSPMPPAVAHALMQARSVVGADDVPASACDDDGVPRAADATGDSRNDAAAPEDEP